MYYQENINALEWQQRIVETAEQYFNCDACNFEFKDSESYFTLDTGIFFVHIKITKLNSSGYVSIMNSKWYSNSDNASFEQVCKSLNNYLKQKAKSLTESLI